MSHRLDDAAVVSALLQQWGAPASVLTRLQATGFTTLGLLGHALPSPDAEDSFLCTVLELDPADSALLHSAPAACLRRLLTHAQDLCPSQYTAAPASSSLRPRTDRQLLRSFLEAEEESPGPTAFVPNSGPIEPTVRKALSVHATALSMLEKVHLLVIKRSTTSFCRLLSLSRLTSP